MDRKINRNNNNLDKKKEELLSLINSFNNNKNEVKTRNKRKFRTLSILNKNVKNVSKKPKKSIKHKKIEFDYSQVFASNEFSNFLSYYSSSISPINRPKDKRNTIINKKFKFNFHLSPRTDRKTVTNILVSKYNLINKNDIIKENLKDENEVDINLKNFKIQLGRQIAYHGYKVFLPRKIANLRDDQRFNSSKIKRQFENKMKTLLKKGSININNNNYIRKDNYKKNTDLLTNRLKSLKIKSILE